ncbi:MAG TPA: DNA-directed RNA polymerase [Candidatus Methanomethylophilaceae archaeon]|nr:DNA-directed RNA polymerase [Candidatus Methanomethylophilaceae archaeon]
MELPRDYDRPRRKETHKTVCSSCGQECEVPFKPTQGRPVYCRECYKIYGPPKKGTF